MELALLLYVVNLIPNISTMLEGLSIIFALFSVGFGVAFFVTWVEGRDAVIDKIKRPTKFVIGCCLITSSLNVLIPEEKTVYMMLGAYTAQKIAQSPVTEQLLDKAGSRINRIIDGSDEINNKIFTIVTQKLDKVILEETAPQSKQ